MWLWRGTFGVVGTFPGAGLNEKMAPISVFRLASNAPGVGVPDATTVGAHGATTVNVPGATTAGVSGESRSGVASFDVAVGEGRASAS